MVVVVQAAVAQVVAARAVAASAEVTGALETVSQGVLALLALEEGPAERREGLRFLRPGAWP